MKIYLIMKNFRDKGDEELVFLQAYTNKEQAEANIKEAHILLKEFTNKSKACWDGLNAAYKGQGGLVNAISIIIQELEKISPRISFDPDYHYTQYPTYSITEVDLK